MIAWFFYDVKIIEKSDENLNPDNSSNVNKEVVTGETVAINDDLNTEFRLCPECSDKSLKTENGCDMCMECGYSKCDK